MDPKKLNHLRQIEIANPCPKNWDAMAGDEQRRFCAGCGCFVHNISELTAETAEALLRKSDKVCTRITVDAKRGVLTRDGWIPKLMLAGAMAATVAGCSPTNGEMAMGTVPAVSSEQQGDILGKVAIQDPKSDPKVFVGDYAVPAKPTKQTKGTLHLLGHRAPITRTMGKPAVPRPPKPPTKPVKKSTAKTSGKIKKKS